MFGSCPTLAFVPVQPANATKKHNHTGVSAVRIVSAVSLDESIRDQGNAESSGAGRTIVRVTYSGAKSDLGFLLRFRDDTFELFGREGKAAKQLRDNGAWIIPSDGKVPFSALRTLRTRRDTRRSDSGSRSA